MKLPIQLTDSLTLKRLVASGGQGKVYEAIKTDDKVGFEKEVIVKFPLIKNTFNIDSLLSEIKILASIKHQNIVDIYDASTSEFGPYLVLEKIEGYSLQRILDISRTLNLEIPLDFIYLIMNEASTGLNYLHNLDKPIYHKDISPQNVLVTKSGQIKIIDFGIGELSGESNEDKKDVTGKLNYIKPELLDGETFNSKHDFYSLKIVLAELYTLKSASEIKENLDDGNLYDFIYDVEFYNCLDKLDTFPNQEILNTAKKKSIEFDVATFIKSEVESRENLKDTIKLSGSDQIRKRSSNRKKLNIIKFGFIPITTVLAFILIGLYYFNSKLPDFYIQKGDELHSIYIPEPNYEVTNIDNTGGKTPRPQLNGSACLISCNFLRNAFSQMMPSYLNKNEEFKKLGREKYIRKYYPIYSSWVSSSRIMFKYCSGISYCSDAFWDLYSYYTSTSENDFLSKFIFAIEEDLESEFKKTLDKKYELEKYSEISIEDYTSSMLERKNYLPGGNSSKYNFFIVDYQPNFDSNTCKNLGDVAYAHFIHTYANKDDDRKTQEILIFPKGSEITIGGKKNYRVVFSQFKDKSQIWTKGLCYYKRENGWFKKAVHFVPKK